MQDLIERARAGMHPLSVRDQLKDAALTTLSAWASEERFAPYRGYMEHLVQQERFDVLLDSFYRMIPFGTGGRRGPVGVGPNRFNPYTLSTSVQGHVAYLRQRFGADTPLATVVAYDVRRFDDLRGLYVGVPGVLTGLTSKDLAWLAARVYAANGVRVHILPADADSYVSTPELSFLIRELGAQGGLNVSASHNHPDDNGGKFYNALGGQEIPPDDEAMAALVQQVYTAELVSVEEAERRELIVPIGPALRHRYIELNRALLPEPASTSARIVFTPLHGTGSTTVQAVLQEAGYAVEPVPSQSTFDGAFPAVPYRIPNPEVPASMGVAQEQAERQGADLVLSTDPDADRLGLLAPDAHGGWRAYTGNEIAALLLAHIIERQVPARRAAGGRPFMVTTWVTTGLLRRMAEAAGVGVVDSLAVGFKFIAEVLRAVEQEGSYTEQGWGRTLQAGLADFVMGTEESHGYLVSPDVRDKDAAGAALLLAEMASLCRDRGVTLDTVLDGVHRRHGVVINRLSSLIMQGAPGLERIAAIQASMRSDPPTHVAGLRIVRTVDWHDTERFGPFLSETDTTTRDVLCWFLENGSRITIRPSGTEPKNKTYVEVSGQPLGPNAPASALAAERERLEALALALADDLTVQALARVQMKVPPAALRVSDLVPLEQRVSVVQTVAPALLQRVEALGPDPTPAARAELKAWLDAELRSCGNDPEGLVAPGMLAAWAKQPPALVQRAMAWLR